MMDNEREIHHNAVKHGWWNEQQPVQERFALIHSELSEALEAWRNQGTKNVEEHYKGDVGEELADTAIRILDFLGGLDAGLVSEDRRSSGSFPSEIGRIHSMVSKAMFAFPSKQGLRFALTKIVAELVGLAESEGFNLEKEVQRKHETNKTKRLSGNTGSV